MKNSPWPVPALLLTVFLLLTFAANLPAIDPLPPELENAPLADQAAWREKMGRESNEQRERVAQERFDQRLAFKQQLMAQIHQDAAERRDAVLSPFPERLPIIESEIVTPKERNGLIIFLLIAAFAFLVRRHLHRQQPVKN